MDLYRKHQRIKYQCGNRALKKKMLDEFCETHGYHRKSATRLLNQLPIADKRHQRPGKAKEYEPEALLKPHRHLWLATDQMCGKRLKQAYRYGYYIIH